MFALRLPTLNIALLFLVFPSALVHTRVVETDDAIVTTVDGAWPDTSKQSLHSNDESDLFRRLPVGEGKQRLEAALKSSAPSCLTNDGQPGNCLSVQQCYPYTRVHQSIGDLETWVIGTKDTCNYVEPNGKQVYGVCCLDVQSRTFRSENSLDNSTAFYDVSSRIVGGSNSYAGEYPFMAGIVSNGKVYCGGSLLDDIHVLTAAHCVSKLTSQGVAQLKVILGSVDLRDSAMITRRVYSVTRHRGFDATKLYNDIALLTLDSPVPFSQSISPVCLYDDVGVNHDGREAIAIGWGNLWDGGPRADTLQKVRLQIKSQDDCSRNFGSKAPGGIVEHFICATAPKKDSCAGDSGGPLMMERGNRQCQVGIVSWGIGCATDTYGVYTRISSFDVWISRNRMRF